MLNILYIDLMVRLYCIGVGILIVAIIANAIVGKLGIMSWYDFLNQITHKGISTLKNVGIINYVWLCIVYPFILSLGYLAGNKFYQVIFN